MRNICHRLKFAWDFFVRGRHRVPKISKCNLGLPLPKLDVHTDPLVGEYVRTQKDTWWSDAKLRGLNYAIRLIAPGQQPTAKQISQFEAVINRLSTLIEVCNLEDAPHNDGWGHSLPVFSIRTANVSSLWLRRDGSFFLIFGVDTKEYMLSPAFEISPDLNLIAAEWSI